MDYQWNKTFKSIRFDWGFSAIFARRPDYRWPNWSWAWKPDFKGMFSSFGPFNLDVYWSKP